MFGFEIAEVVELQTLNAISKLGKDTSQFYQQRAKEKCEHNIFSSLRHLDEFFILD